MCLNFWRIWWGSEAAYAPLSTSTKWLRENHALVRYLGS